MAITKKTHFNPCFWSALWNPTYYQHFLHGDIKLKARNQYLHYLDINSDQALYQSTENLFYEKYLGSAVIKPNHLKDFCSKYNPEMYDSLCKNLDKDPEELILDFEDNFSLMENSECYSVLFDIIKNKKLSSLEQKIQLALFVLIHRLRNPVFINSRVEIYKAMGLEKFEFLLFLQYMLTDEIFYSVHILFLLESNWTIYCLAKRWFPLSDNPIMKCDEGILAILSPNMLLEIIPKISGIKPADINQRSQWIKERVVLKHDISAMKYQKFKKAIISNTHKGLVFYDEKQLKSWKLSNWWNQRRNLILSNKNYNELVYSDELGELWSINFLSNKLQ